MESNVKHHTIEMTNATFFALLEQELAERKSVRLRVKGVSMQPMLRNNRDEVQLVPYKGEKLTPKDICLFRYQGRHILHRYLHTEGDIVYFRGDNVLTRVEHCRCEDIVGVVETVYRDGLALPSYSESWRFKIMVNRFMQRIRFLISSCLPKSFKQMIKRMMGIKTQQ